MSLIASCSAQAIGGNKTRFRIIPAGLFRARDGRPQNLPGWMMDRTVAQRIIAATAASKGDVVIDYEHQTLDAHNKTGAVPAAGWFKQLEWVEGDGLYVTDARWTARASQMIDAKEYRYISPVFAFDALGMVVGLHSIALTNNPALDGLTDLAAATSQMNAALPNGISARDHATMQHVFGENYAHDIARLNAMQQAELAVSVPPPGITSLDHHKLQHIFGQDYANGVWGN